MLKCKATVAFAAMLAAMSSFAQEFDQEFDACNELPSRDADHWCLYDSFGIKDENNSGTQFALWLTPTSTSAAPEPQDSTESSNGSIIGVMRIPEQILTAIDGAGTLCPVSGDYVNLGEVGVGSDVYEYRVGLFSNCWCGDGGNPAKRTFALEVGDNGPLSPQLMTDNLDAHSFRCGWWWTDVTLGAQIGPDVTPTSTPSTTPDVVNVPKGWVWGLMD